jgi:putative hydrolase of the HAD superfamily
MKFDVKSNSYGKILSIELFVDENSVFCFDLDDTLYKEIDFLKSAYKEIAQHFSDQDWRKTYEVMLDDFCNKRNVFARLVENSRDQSTSIATLLKFYRNHFPQIKLDKDTSTFLSRLKKNDLKTALITDGRSKTQRNKLKALGLEKFFDLVIISEEIGSEKPAKANFQIVEKFFGNGEFLYIADNFNKDFVTPNNLGWLTIALKDNGQNIHTFRKNLLDSNFFPKFQIDSLAEINLKTKNK